jgi:hypothetical protein
MHYVEYHLLMSPRIFSGGSSEPVSARKEEAAPPTGARRVRAHVVAFYVALLGIVIAFEARTHVSVPANLVPVVHLFDGIFVVHYFVEALVWKFTNPYYRRQLVPLYLGGVPSGAGEGQRPSAKLPTWAEATAIALVAVIAGFALLHDERLSTAFDRRFARRMGAQLELEWGADLAQAGDLARAEERFVRAAALDPENRDAEQALVQARLFRARLAQGGRP